MIMHIKGIAATAYSGRTNNNVRIPTVQQQHRLVITSQVTQQQLTDTLKPPSATLFTVFTLYVVIVTLLA